MQGEYLTFIDNYDRIIIAWRKRGWINYVIFYLI